MRKRSDPTDKSGELEGGDESPQSKGAVALQPQLLLHHADEVGLAGG